MLAQGFAGARIHVLRMNKALFTVTLGTLVCAGQAQVPLADPGLARSLSGQFVVRAARPAELAAPARNLATNQNLIRLEPSLVAVSCERVRQALCRELQSDAPWRGKVFVWLYPADSPDDPATLTSELFRDGWRYRLDLPDFIERSHFISAVVEAVLLEMANRNAGTHSAELPAWLVEGLSQQLQITHGIEILLPPPQAAGTGLSLVSASFNGRKEAPLERAHKILTTRPALTFEQLSWPRGEEMAGGDRELYRCSAQLFVDDLLELEDGRACLQSMLADLPDFYNWQLAFLRAFRSHFARPLDTEKWWALQVSRFTGRALTQNWPASESWRKLDEALRLGVQLRAGTNELPTHADVSLQTAIQDWDTVRQTAALEDKLRDLELMRSRTSPEFVPILDQYRYVLTTYLQERDHPSTILPWRKKSTVRRRVDEAIRQLDSLDARRQAMRALPETSPVPTQAKF
jgi:hypothetical protein